AEFWVAVIPKRHAVKVVRSRLGRGIDYAAGRVPELSRISGSLNRELLHGLGREAHHGTRNSDTGVIDAIGKDGRTASPTAVQIQVKTRDRLARSYFRILTARIARYIRGGERKIKHATIVQWNILQLTGRDRMGRGSGLGVKQRCIGSHDNLFGYRSGFQRHVSSRYGGGIDL